MKYLNKNILKTILLIFSFSVFSFGQTTNRTPLEVVKSIADKIINDCQFEFEMSEQKNVLGVQIIDFMGVHPFGKKQFSPVISGSSYALSFVQSEYDTLVNLGISASPNISVWINDETINFNSTQNPEIHEIAYGMISFYDTVSVKINKGTNKLLIKAADYSNSKIILRQITDNPEAAGWLKYSAFSDSTKQNEAEWLIIGPFGNQDKNLQENPIKNYYENNGNYLSWSTPKKNILTELKIGEENIFKKDSYADWNYANGATMFGILNFAEISDDKKYKNFVDQWCQFIISNKEYFKWQYDSLNALRGSYHRIFRKSMLDDAGARALPFVHLYMNDKKENYYPLVKEMSDYVFNEQVRLEDGTFCRPEPVEMTVWADDLFMSVPMLLRMGKITGEEKYYDDVVNQFKNFTALLYNKEKKLFKHGWFSKINKTSPVFWGRANGWVMWALSEALLYLPENHEGYSDVMDIYKTLVDGLVKYQDESGMWHQVLDHPESYEESSCTAMFILGIARGVSNGWLDESYRNYALKGWGALTTKIEPEGIVHGICRGTGIGEDIEFYFNRPTFDNDPRGLGAVLTAGTEISKLQKK